MVSDKSTHPKNYYEILGISKNASIKEISRAFRKKALEHHPDRGGSDVFFMKAAKAYQILSNNDTRAMYDKTLSCDIQHSIKPTMTGAGLADLFKTKEFSMVDDNDDCFFDDIWRKTEVILPISPAEAVLGGEIQLKTESEKVIKIVIPSGTQHGDRIEVNKELGVIMSLIVNIRIPDVIGSDRELWEALPDGTHLRKNMVI